jgi:peptidoglycan/LPS O-acetylase OafA/YrhL
MIENLPIWIDLTFIFTCVLTICLFHFSNGRPKKLTLLIIVWSIMQSILAYIGFYQNTDSIPPRFGLVLIPTTFLIIYGLLPKQQKWVSKTRQTKISTFLHSVRLPVEIVLFGLFINKMIPELMTFEGRNYDILIGITAPIIGGLFAKQKISKKILMGWNIIGLILVLFILFNGILSAELPFQQFGFERPNRAVNYFPFVLLPATIVPIVIWTHISDIIKLKKEIKTTPQSSRRLRQLN